MARQRRTYTSEFKVEAVKLVTEERDEAVIDTNGGDISPRQFGPGSTLPEFLKLNKNVASSKLIDGLDRSR